MTTVDPAFRYCPTCQRQRLHIWNFTADTYRCPCGTLGQSSPDGHQTTPGAGRRMCPHCKTDSMRVIAQYGQGLKWCAQWLCLSCGMQGMQLGNAFTVEPNMGTEDIPAPVQKPPSDAREWACPTCGGDLLWHSQAQMLACKERAVGYASVRPKTATELPAGRAIALGGLPKE